jgi:release factor glutamine methyltransferase
LIPRPETEELVDWVLEHIGKTIGRSGKPLNLLDVGTGSGCIAVSLKINLPVAQVFALDISEQALSIASDNAAMNQTDIRFINSDIRNYITQQRFDVIVSNPPYITLNEQAEMSENVLAHEPHLALFVSNEDPLVFYAAIADFALKNLVEDGLLFFEINEYLGKETVDLLSHKGLKNIELRKDMQGKDRMVRCCRN